MSNGSVLATDVTYEEEEDDGLGYYPDGTKRTLTDQQIEIFRHSEIRNLLQERRVKAEAKSEGEDRKAKEKGGSIPDEKAEKSRFHCESNGSNRSRYESEKNKAKSSKRSTNAVKRAPSPTLDALDYTETNEVSQSRNLQSLQENHHFVRSLVRYDD